MCAEHDLNEFGGLLKRSGSNEQLSYKLLQLPTRCNLEKKKHCPQHDQVGGGRWFFFLQRAQPVLERPELWGASTKPAPLVDRKNNKSSIRKNWIRTLIHGAYEWVNKLRQAAFLCIQFPVPGETPTVHLLRQDQLSITSLNWNYNASDTSASAPGLICTIFAR